MKALFIGYTDEINGSIEKLMERHFPSIELRTLKPPYSASDLMIILTTDGPFSFLILSIDDWKVEIINVYETIIDTIGERPFLFIGNFASMKGQIKKEILDKPQTNFLITTPLLPNDLVDAVKSSVEWSKNEEFEESIQEFKKEDLQKMRMRNFYLFDQLPYDVYLELTPTQFGKIISKNRPYSHQIIRNYAKKNVKYLYLKSDDYLKFLDTAIKSMLTIYEAKSTERKKIVSLHLKTLFFIHQYLKTLSVSEDIIKLTKAFIESTKIFIKDQENITSLIEGVLESKNLTFAEQSLATAYVCEGMLLEMGWRSEMSRDKLLLASILQDIGLSNDEFIRIK